MLPGVELSNQDGIAIATIPPEIDLSNVREVRARIFDHASSSWALVIDLSRSTYLDSKGIHLLMELDQFSRQSQQPVRLVVVREQPVARLLDIAGVPIRRHESVELAVEDVLRDRPAFPEGPA
ncbi:MAG TPA: STAS domain-containing protein [bacterium]